MSLSDHVTLEGRTFIDKDANATAEVLLTGTPTGYGVEGDNSQNVDASFIKIWDATSASVGSDDPEFIIKVPESSVRRQPLGFPGSGHAFALGICVAVVTTGGTAGSTAPTNDVGLEVKTTAT